MTYVKLGALLAAIAVAFIAGYKYAAALYAKDMANYQAAQSAATRQQEAQYRKKEQENAQRLVAALDERDKALANLGDLRSDLDRLRESAKRGSALRAVSGSCAAAIKPYQERIAGCTKLLIEGASLLQQGADLAGRTAADKDAVAKTVR